MKRSIGITRNRRDSVARILEHRSAILSTRVAGLTALVVLLFLLLHAASSHTFSGNSDGATVMLEGLSMSAGHITLHGWSMTVESFWGVDAVVYALAIRVVGLRPDLMHIVPTILAMFVIAIGGYLAAIERAGAKALLGIGVVIVLLGLPSPDLAYFFLQGPWHVGTTLWCLCAFVGLSQGRFGWGWFIAVGFFAAGLLGDFMTVTVGVLPVLIAGIIAMRRGRNWKSDLAAIAAVPASVATAIVLHLIAAAIGTFSVVNRNVPVSISQIGWNIRHIPALFSALLGFGTLQVGISAGPYPLQLAHLVGVFVVVIGIVFAIRRTAAAIISPPRPALEISRSDRIEDLLMVSFIGDIATFVLLSPTWNPNNVRYLTPGVICGVILGARFVAARVGSLRGARSMRAVIVASSIVLVACSLDVANYLSAPVAQQPVVKLAQFLEKHQLTSGVGDYWSSSLVTVKTAAKVTIRPVTVSDGRLRRFDRQSSASWYAGQTFEFFVYDTARPWQDVNSTTAEATFGKPVHIYTVGSYRVLVWPSLLVFSPALRAQPQPIKLFFRL